MEVQEGMPSTTKRKNGPHIDWNNQQVVEILRKMEQDKSIKWEEGCEMVKKVTGSSISTMTLRRQLAKAQQRAEAESIKADGDRKGSGTSNSEEDMQGMNWYFGLSKTGTKCLVVESDEGVRHYRRVCVGRDNGVEYFRCSCCDRLNMHGRKAIRFTNGRLTSSLRVQHHSKCPPLSPVASRSLQIDRQCRRDVKEGVMTPRQAWTKGQLDAQKSGIPQEAFPPWKAVRSQYSAIVRRTTQPVKNHRQRNTSATNESSTVQQLLSVVHNMEARMQQCEQRIQQLEDQLANRDIVVAYEY